MINLKCVNYVGLVVVLGLVSCSGSPQAASGTAAAASGLQSWSSSDVFAGLSKLTTTQRQGIDATINGMSMMQYFNSVKAIMTNDTVTVDGYRFVDSLSKFSAQASLFAALGQKFSSFGEFARAANVGSVSGLNLSSFKSEVVPTSTALGLTALPENAVKSKDCDGRLKDLSAATGQTQAQLGAALGAALGALPAPTAAQPAAITVASFASGNPTTTVRGKSIHDFEHHSPSATGSGIEMNYSEPNSCGEGVDGAGKPICPAGWDGGVYGIPNLEDYGANRPDGEGDTDPDGIYDSEGDDPEGIETLSNCFDNTPYTNKAAFSYLPGVGK